MMRSFMYLRPGNLYKDFLVKSNMTEIKGGYSVNKYVETGNHVIGVLAEASSKLSDNMKNRWDQSQHTLTHTLVVRGKSHVKKQDHLILGERGFLVLTIDDISTLGISEIIYLEERNDVK